MVDIQPVPIALTDLASLKARMRVLFDNPDLVFADFLVHQVMFVCPGRPKAVCAALQQRSDPQKWRVEDNVVWTYEDAAENLFMTVQAGGRGMTLVLASVMSLHQVYLQHWTGS